MQGAFDSPLTATGIEQAKAQRRILARFDLQKHQFYCSPQGRAVETAKHALKGLQKSHQSDDRLREIDVGEWNGQKYRDIDIKGLMAQDPAALYRFYDTAPKGEHLAALHQRCHDFLQALSGAALIITHGTTLRMLRLIALGWDMPRLFKKPDTQGVVYEICNGQEVQHS